MKRIFYAVSDNNQPQKISMVEIPRPQYKVLIFFFKKQFVNRLQTQRFKISNQYRISNDITLRVYLFNTLK